MIDTTDLTSYYSGYEDYIEPKKQIDYDSFAGIDEIIDEQRLRRKELEDMKRPIIYLSKTNITLEEAFKLQNYVWEKDKLIPTEELEGE